MIQHQLIENLGRKLRIKHGPLSEKNSTFLSFFARVVVFYFWLHYL